MRLGIREFSFITLLLGMVAGTFAMIVQTHATQRRQRLAQVESMDAAVRTLRQATAGIDAITCGIDHQNKAVAFFQSKLPKPSETDDVIREITEMASANSLQTGSAVVLRPGSVNGYGAQPIQLTATGDFNGLYSFILQLEKSPHALRINRMKVSCTGRCDGDVRAELEICIFQVPDAAASPAANASAN